jgi:hypothetical protein
VIIESSDVYVDGRPSLVVYVDGRPSLVGCVDGREMPLLLPDVVVVLSGLLICLRCLGHLLSVIACLPV